MTVMVVVAVVAFKFNVHIITAAAATTSAKQHVVPLPRRVFSDHGYEAFEGAEDSSVDENRRARLPVGVLVLQAKALRELKVKLDGCALVLPGEGISHRHIYLRAF